MKKFTLMLLLQLMGVWLFANTNESYQIKGRVTDENRSPLIGASVVLENTLQGCTTDSYGNYSMRKVKSGVYTLSVSFIGFEKKSLELNVDKDLTIDISLTPSSILGEEIVVNATRASSRMPIAQTSMSKEEIKKTSVGLDIPYLLEMTPSVVATSEGGTGIGNTAFRIRGTDMSRINVTVNGIPLNDPESQGVYWVDLPDFTSSVDNIQVQRGIGTSTNGAAAFGASVNFQTTTLSPEPFTNIDLQAGSFGSWRTAAKIGTGLLNKKFSFEGRFSQLKSDGYIDRGTSDDRSIFLTGAWHTSKSLLRFNLIHGEEHTGITWTGTPGYMLDSIRTYNPEGVYKDTSGNTHYYRDQKDNYTQTHYQLIYSNQLTNSISLSSALFWVKGAGYYEEYKDDSLGYGNRFSDYALIGPIHKNDTLKTTDMIRQKWMANDFYGTTLSLNYRKGAIDAALGGGWNRYEGNHFGKILWSEVNNGIPNNYQWYRNTSVKTDFNIFGKATYQFTNMLSMFGDMQFRSINYKLKGPNDDQVNLDQSHNWNFYNPKFGTVIKISSHQEIFASFGVGHREPTREDLKDTTKTPSSERLFDYEVGYTCKTPNFVMGLNLYYMDYKDQLVLTGKLSDVGYPLMTNVDKSYRAGVEIAAGIKPLTWLSWNVNSTLSINRIKNFVEYVELYDNSTDWKKAGQEMKSLGDTPISFSPSIVGSSQIAVTPIKSITISLMSKYVGEQYYDNTGSAARRLDGYLVNNFKVDYSFKVKSVKAINIQLFVNNLFNNKYLANAWVYRAHFVNGDPEYREDGFFPQAGTNFMVKLGVEF